MIRYVVCVAAFIAPSLTALAQSETANTQTGSSSMQSSQTNANQTFDPTSAFDGYWIPPRRATEGEEDR